LRDFRDAKAMARALRDALNAKAIETTHTESLELIAKAFGYENWNILSAKIEAADPAASDERRLSAAAQDSPPPPRTLYCSFCGKSQHDVAKLIAGPPPVLICDECVDICTDVVEPDDDKELFRVTKANEESARQGYPALLELADHNQGSISDAAGIGGVAAGAAFGLTLVQFPPQSGLNLRYFLPTLVPLLLLAGITTGFLVAVGLGATRLLMRL